MWLLLYYGCGWQHDVNSDGVLEFVFTTTDAEIVFVETDNTLVHGETIKVCDYTLPYVLRALER